MNMEKKAKEAAEATDWNPMKTLNKAGIRSGHAYTAGLISVVIALLSWIVSRGKGEEKPQSDRWGIFVGQWAPTLMAIGVGLRLEEKK